MAVTQEQLQTMAGNADVVEIFEGEGNFSFLRGPHRFIFRIHSDSSLRVDIKPVSTATASVGEVPVPGTIEDIDGIEEDQYQISRETITEDVTVPEDAPQAQEESDETVAKMLAYDGRALVEMPPEGRQDDTQPHCYMVHFKIVQWGRGAQSMWSQIVKCIARLSQEQGLAGRFVDIRENVEEAQDFALRPIAHRLEALDNPLHPLTPGRYELHGITIAENTFVYECAVNLTLQANGMMSGTSRELPFTQECPLAGMWTRSGLNFLLEYEMHGNKHTYIYFGTPFRSGLQGTWQNSELRVLGEISTHEQVKLNAVPFRLRSDVYVPLKPLERVYDGCVGGFLAEKSRIHLCIASDGTLHGEVRQKQPSSQALANGKKRKRRVVADHPDGIVIAHVMGNAQVVPSKRRDTGSIAEDQIKEEASEEQKVFELQPVQWYQRQQEAEEAEKEAAMMQSRPPSLLYPLRAGKYEFKGFTTYDTPSVAAAVVPRQRNGRRGRPVVTTVKDECLVTLRLLPDGTLRGTSREVVQPQVCPLKGRWQANRVAYVLEYRVREAVGHFRYSGAVVIEQGEANGKKTKVKKANANGKRRETLSGKWHNVDDGHAEGYEGGRGEFELELVRVDFTPISIKTEKLETSTVNDSSPSSDLQQEQQKTDPGSGSNAANAIVVDDDDDAIHAFTTGEYELSGCATDAEGYEYAFDLQLQLRPGGKLLGKCKERIFHQVSPVFGRWNPSCITYGQQYVVKHEVGMYTYTATMSSDGAVVRGSWANVEKDSASAPSEHGTFALVLVNSTRQWSTFSHAHYPPRFRRAVLTTLMASARPTSCLWYYGRMF
ncbi:hypothetical protein GQ600_9427 [Phytophthora cactorum]|nr:hypothetical protein GQ600_9427 [Phytophthora cactorum]